MFELRVKGEVRFASLQCGGASQEVFIVSVTPPIVASGNALAHVAAHVLKVL